MPELQVGKIIDGWTLIKSLGSGGNSQVWRATREGKEVALKVLNQTKPLSEPFRRFRAEIDVLRQLGDYEGILPLLDAHLPEHPSRNEPAWLAMPVAVLVRDKLGEEPDVDASIQCVYAIANALAALHTTHNIFHRDIKPENLYWFNGKWCLGDFGLVEYPDKTGLTLPGRWVGPILYLAPELLQSPDSADPATADVYALAKTLWTILVRQRVPLPGHLDRLQDHFRLTYYVRDPRLNSVELLLDRATRHNPGERPTMRDFAGELGAWLCPTTADDSAKDLTALQLEVAPVIAKHISIRKVHEELRAHANALLEDIQAQLAILQSNLTTTLDMRADLSRGTQLQRLPSLRTFWNRNTPYTAPSSVSVIAEDRGSRSNIELFGGIAIILTSSTECIVLAAGYGLKTGRQPHEKYQEIWSSAKGVVPRSADAASSLAQLIIGLHENAERAIKVFVEALPH